MTSTKKRPGSSRPRSFHVAAALLLLAPLSLVGLIFALPQAASEDASAGTPAGEPTPPSDRFAVVGARVFDGERTWPRATVWVEEGRIRAIGAELELPADLPRVDGAGHTLLPGLIDAHVHTWGAARQDALRFGVTTLLDQFTAPDSVVEARQDRLDGGAFVRADLFSAGFLATAAAGHGTQFGIDVPTLDGETDVAGWVRARKSEGSDWIKLVIEPGWDEETLATLGPETVRALIAAAHDQGLKAVAHASNLDDALMAVEAGADGLVHVWRDRVPSESELYRLRRAGAFVVPTLVVLEGMVDPEPSLQAADGSLGPRLSAAQRSGLERRFPARYTPEWTAVLDSVRRLEQAGIPILAGSDAPNPTTAMGFSLHRELQLLVAAGLSPEQALRAATSVAADAFGLEGRGRIDAGTLADLVLVEGDPTADIDATTRLVHIWKRGRILADPLGTGSAPEAEAATEPVAEAPAETLLSDFENGLTTRFGAGWTTTTDRMRGGASEAEATVENGALVIAGELRGGTMYPWAGAMAFPGPRQMHAVDMSSRSTLTFRVRGDGKTYSAMLFSGDMQGIPAAKTFEAPSTWTRVELPLNELHGADLATLRAVAFVATGRPRAFRFEIDDVEIR